VLRPRRRIPSTWDGSPPLYGTGLDGLGSGRSLDGAWERPVPSRRGCAIPALMPATTEEIAELLGRVPLFSGLAAEDLASVAEVAMPRRFAPGVVVFREGDEGDTCYVVRSGRARAVREHGDGRSITFAHFRPGDIFGELAMFEGDSRSATVETVEETEVLAILAADMRRLLERHPTLAVKLIAALGRRLRHTNERLARQSFQTVPGRVASVLGQLAAAGGEGEVLITSTQADLAQLAGTSRESVSRFMAVLERAGIITQGRGRLIVHDPPALERYVY
jgi:CRP-like cAMP-binding protein